MGKKLFILILCFIALGLVGVLTLFNSSPVSKVVACDPSCVSTGPQCGTDNGKQEVLICPEGYSANPGHDNCRKKIYQARPYHWDWVCPSDQSAYTSHDVKDCKWSWRIDNKWHYADKIQEKNYENCPAGWGVDDNDHTQCKKWDYQDKVKVTQPCHTGVIQYDSCTPLGECPTECGYLGGTIPDGEGGEKQCEPTSSCPVTPSPTPEASPTPTPTPTPSISEGGGGGVGGPPSCGATKPGAPTLLGAAKTGSKAVLSWTAVSGITHYALEYGLSSGNYTYGVTNTGNTTSFTVSDLDPGSNYCFAVRAINDCAPGDLSNEICTGAVLGAATGQVLGLSTTASGNSLINTFSLLGILCLLLSLKSFLTQKNLI